MVDKEHEEVKVNCKMGSPPTDAITYSGFQRIKVFPGCRVQSRHFVLDGATNMYSQPHDIHIQIPNLHSLEDFKQLQQHLNVSLDQVNAITSQQALRIPDIDALFKKYEQSNVITLTLISSIVFVIGVLLTCFCFFKCCLPCYRSFRDSFQSQAPSTPRRPVESDDQEEIELQERRHW